MAWIAHRGKTNTPAAGGGCRKLLRFPQVRGRPCKTVQTASELRGERYIGGGAVQELQFFWGLLEKLADLPSQQTRCNDEHGAVDGRVSIFDGTQGSPGKSDLFGKVFL